VKSLTVYVEIPARDTIKYEYYDEIIDVKDTFLYTYSEYDIGGKMIFKLTFNKKGDTVSVFSKPIKKIDKPVEKKINSFDLKNIQFKYDSFGREIERYKLNYNSRSDKFDSISDYTYTAYHGSTNEIKNKIEYIAAFKIKTEEELEWYNNHLLKSKHTKEYLDNKLMSNNIDFFDKIGNRIKTIDSLNKKIYEAKFDNKKNVIEQSFYDFNNKLTYRWQGTYDKYNNLFYQKMTEKDGSTRENRFINQYTFY